MWQGRFDARTERGKIEELYYLFLINMYLFPLIERSARCEEGLSFVVILRFLQCIWWNSLIDYCNGLYGYALKGMKGIISLMLSLTFEIFTEPTFGKFGIFQRESSSIYLNIIIIWYIHSFFSWLTYVYQKLNQK